MAFDGMFVVYKTFKNEIHSESMKTFLEAVFLKKTVRADSGMKDLKLWRVTRLSCE